MTRHNRTVDEAEKDEGARAGTIWYARLIPGSNMMFPVRMKLSTQIGTVDAYLAELQSSKANLKLQELDRDFVKIDSERIHRKIRCDSFAPVCVLTSSKPPGCDSPSVETHHPGDTPMHTVTTLAKLLKNEDGATAIEYGLIAALIAVAAVAAMTTVGTNLTALFTVDRDQPDAVTHGRSDRLHRTAFQDTGSTGGGLRLAGYGDLPPARYSAAVRDSAPGGRGAPARRLFGPIKRRPELH